MSWALKTLIATLFLCQIERMFKMKDAETDADDYDSRPSDEDGRKLHVVHPDTPAEAPAKERANPGLTDWLKTMIKGKSDTTLREALEEYIEDAEGDGSLTSLNVQEKALIANILKLRDLNVVDVMIPRVDISAIDVTISQSDLLSLLADKQFSRLPVYRDGLDDVLGTIHIKDILATLAAGQAIRVPELIRDVPIVAPSMPVLDLLLMMKQRRRHMALVVDEYGGIDGLATIGDVLEAIVGEVEDEYDQESHPQLIRADDGTAQADGRVDIEEFEHMFGDILTEEERDDIDTLGGLVFALAGRIPARGEIITHPTGMIFEVLDADLRRVKRVLIRNIPVAEE
jgi:CBS domain containing-hemolysin-like protein